VDLSVKTVRKAVLKAEREGTEVRRDRGPLVGEGRSDLRAVRGEARRGGRPTGHVRWASMKPRALLFLFLLLAASTTLIGSIFAGKKWSGSLMSLRGLTVPLVFLVGIIAGTQVVRPMGLSVPTAGAFALNYVLRVGNNEVLIRAPSEVLFTTDFVMALVAGVITLMAKIVHGKTLRR